MSSSLKPKKVNRTTEPRHMKYLPLLVCLALAGCETTGEVMNAGDMARASTVRVVQDREPVKECTLLGGVSATEQVHDWLKRPQEITAIDLLKFHAQKVGADTVLITSSQVSQASGLTTLTGDAYRCASGSK
jgi:hypothetical protein